MDRQSMKKGPHFLGLASPAVTSCSRGPAAAARDDCLVSRGPPEVQNGDNDEGDEGEGRNDPGQHHGGVVGVLALVAVARLAGRSHHCRRDISVSIINGQLLVSTEYVCLSTRSVSSLDSALF